VTHELTDVARFLDANSREKAAHPASPA